MIFQTVALVFALILAFVGVGFVCLAFAVAAFWEWQDSKETAARRERLRKRASGS